MAALTAQATFPFKYTVPLKTATDVDGDTLKYHIDNAMLWLRFNETTRELYGTPTVSDVGKKSFSLIASDGQVNTTLPVDIQVAEAPPEPPLLTEGQLALLSSIGSGLAVLGLIAAVFVYGRRKLGRVNAATQALMRPLLAEPQSTQSPLHAVSERTTFASLSEAYWQRDYLSFPRRTAEFKDAAIRFARANPRVRLFNSIDMNGLVETLIAEARHKAEVKEFDADFYAQLKLLQELLGTLLLVDTGRDLPISEVTKMDLLSKLRELSSKVEAVEGLFYVKCCQDAVASMQDSDSMLRMAKRNITSITKPVKLGLNLKSLYTNIPDGWYTQLLQQELRLEAAKQNSAVVEAIKTTLLASSDWRALYGAGKLFQAIAEGSVNLAVKGAVQTALVELQGKAKFKLFKGRAAWIQQATKSLPVGGGLRVGVTKGLRSPRSTVVVARQTATVRGAMTLFKKPRDLPASRRGDSTKAMAEGRRASLAAAKGDQGSTQNPLRAVRAS